MPCRPFCAVQCLSPPSLLRTLADRPYWRPLVLNVRNKVLLVEDEPQFHRMVKDYLEANGYEVTVAESCSKAEQLWRSARPDIALFDYNLPDGNALDMLPRLK